MRHWVFAAMAVLAVPATAQLNRGVLAPVDARAPTAAKLPKATLPADRAQIFMKLTGDAAAKSPSTTRRVSVMKLVDNGVWLKLIGVQASGDPSGKLSDGYAYVFGGDKASHSIQLTLPKSAKPMLVDCWINANWPLESEITSNLTKVGGGPIPKGDHAYLAVPPSPANDVTVRLFSPDGRDWHFFACEITQMG